MQHQVVNPIPVAQIHIQIVTEQNDITGLAIGTLNLVATISNFGTALLLDLLFVGMDDLGQIY
jgi:hypothetical protein